MPDDPFLGFATDALRFDKLLGKGGMGAVYLGEQLRMNRMVAIKVIAQHLVTDPKYIERFTREAQVLGRLVHPNVIACHDYGPSLGPKGEPIYVMVLEYVDGWSLGALSRLKRLTVRQTLDLYRQAAEGLAFAHKLGVVHRDIKPDNILVTKKGVAKIADFGLARSEDSVQVTQTGAIIGSPAYMAPEACRGEDPTPRSDIYSLGCALYQTLTDQPPYTSQSTLQVLNQHLTDPVPNLLHQRADLTRLQPLLAKCLAKRPADRWSDAQAFADALRAEIPHHAEDLVAGRLLRNRGGSGVAPATVLTGAAATVKETIATTSPSSAPGNRRWIIALAALVVVLAATGVALAHAATPATPPDETPVVVNPTPVIPVRPSPPPTLDGRFPTDRIDAMLDKADGLIKNGHLGEAEVTLDNLRSLFTVEQLPVATRTRLDALQSALGQAVSSAEPQVAGDLDRAEKALGVGDRTIADGLLQRDVPKRFAQRREELRRRLHELPKPPATGGSVQMLKPMRGEPVPPRLLPDFAPLASQPIYASVKDGASQVVRLKLPAGQATTDGDGLMVMLGSDGQQLVTVSAVSGDKRQQITSFTLNERSWSVNTIPLPAGTRSDELQLTSAGGPFLFVAAALGTGGRKPSVRDLEIAPGTLSSRDLRAAVDTVIAAGRTDFPNFATTRMLVPQSVIDALPHGRDDLLAALNRGLLTVGGGTATAITAADIRAVGTSGDMAKETESLGATQLLLVYVATGVGTLRQPGQYRFLSELPAKGVLPVMIIGSENAGRGFDAGQGNKLLHRLFENVGDERMPIRVMLDLGAVPAFYQAQESPLDPKSSEFQQQILSGFEAGLRQLRDRLLAAAESGKKKPKP